MNFSYPACLLHLEFEIHMTFHTGSLEYLGLVVNNVALQAIYRPHMTVMRVYVQLAGTLSHF